jgi:lipoprotein-anchoring transpeptidase ErfK/SrfK
MNTPEHYLHISIATQQLALIHHTKVEKTYTISTAKNGAGEKMGSLCTPTGWHQIRAKIGQDQPLNAVFIGRRPTGEIYSPHLGIKYPMKDWVLSRIMWLSGLEAGKNRYGSVDSAWRYIYIHGCPDELMLGKPESHGCVRMKNNDVIDLFDKVSHRLHVLIE